MDKLKIEKEPQINGKLKVTDKTLLYIILAIAVLGAFFLLKK